MTRGAFFNWRKEYERQHGSLPQEYPRGRSGTGSTSDISDVPIQEANAGTPALAEAPSTLEGRDGALPSDVGVQPAARKPEAGEGTPSPALPYTRDLDGRRMIEVAPGRFVNERALRKIEAAG